ncbi:MAG: FliM/FliN family flagellar motor switch protein [Phycisphaerales bacterium]|nr:FliM/FliN family flagellar motor switch protein [Phycisphaerales bacterium]MCB9856814.1 FliM/FliN family flagellar motor switch protein [Phycisphaerales bacterium]MCB9862059.1 FliM/FliN family flagellar motor switch protein [Phycisphaerales bacterium]
MFSQEDIDAVLRDAQQAVDELAQDVGQLHGGDSTPSHAPSGTAVAARPAQATVAPPRPVGAHVKRILKLKVPVIVRLARRNMLVSSIMKMGPGTILEFDRTVDEELDLMINNCKIGAGVAVKVNEHFGIRITNIDTVEERIDSLGAR